MEENKKKTIDGTLITVSTLVNDLRRLGVKEGMTLLVHSSFKSLGSWVLGGPVSVLLALEEVIGRTGTLVMPTHSGDLSDPAGWSNPPVPEAWWDDIRKEMPPYHADLTPLWGMGIIPDTFRRQAGTQRSGHPQLSFAARGPYTDFIVGQHSLENSLGEASPLARIYDNKGWVLLIGVSHQSNTSLHLAEYRASFSSKKPITNQAPMLVDSERKWVRFNDIEFSTDDFEQIGSDFEHDTGLVIRGRIAGAEAMLIPQAELVDYGTKWMENNRF
ncbi:aminoglycoside 3-N-acetyltransferase [Fontibacillus panacisegetis]|uniref:Aminoglycoside N(3)-acetyltransferase n=1 Tax=Fontibacillus panacisegetis TaxID=670482 RepID=A0A1G7HCH3_9BACL|nr:AAC(3) family N-acetyltransferase [Fontibacillus panacisegetis]SDE98004.1 aminoglycoside 3-N-acetyltransferase [Fontibacillus panacisegetis]